MQALAHAAIDERLRVLAARSPDASIYCVDPFGAHFVDIPQNARQLFRWSLSADTPIELMAPDHRVRGAELFVICRKTGSSQGRVRLADAPDDDVDLHLLNGGDWVIGVAVEVAASTTTTTAAAPDTGTAIANAVIHRNRVGRIVDADAAALRLLGRSRTRVLGARLDDFSHPGDVDLCTNAWAAIAADTDGVQHLRRRIRAEDGSIVWVEQHDKNALGTPLGVVITELVDVTATILVQQRDTFHTALNEQLDDDSTAMVYLRQDRTIDYANPRWGQLTGLGSDAPFYEFIAAVHEPEAVETAVTRTFGYTTPADTMLTLRSHPRAPERRVRMQTRLLEGPDGAPGVMVALDEVAQVRIGTDGGARMRRNDTGPRSPGSDGPGAAASTSSETSSTDDVVADLAASGSLLDPLAAPTPANVSSPLSGGRRAGDRPDSSGQAGVASGIFDRSSGDDAFGSADPRRSDEPPNSHVAPGRTPTIGTGQPTVVADAAERDAARGTDPAAVEATTWSSRFAALAGLLCVVLTAAFTRLWQLDSLPDGTLEVERWNAEVARRIADGASVGAYARNGFDQPAGGLNAFALGDWISLNSATDLRRVSAVVGCLGVIAAYWAVRRWVGAAEAVASGMALGLMVWHIHFSRLSVGEIFWPLLLTIGVGLLARSPQRLVAWVLAGLAFGAMVWFSNAAWLALGAIGVVTLVWVVGGRRRARLALGPGLGGSFARVLAAAVAAGVVAWPVAAELFGERRNDRDFGGLDRDLSGSFWDAFGDLLSGWAHTWVDLVASPDSNRVDASGIALPVGWVLALLAVVGLLLLLIRDRSLATWITAALIAVLPFGPALAADGSVRHALGLAPLLAILAGIAAAWVTRTIMHGYPRRGRLLGLVVVVLLLALVGWSTYVEYFDSFPANVELLGLLEL